MGVMAVTTGRVRRLGPTRRKVHHILLVAQTSALVMHLLLILYVLLPTRLLMILLVCELHLHLLLGCSLLIVVIILITIGVANYIGGAPTAAIHLLKV